METKQRLRPNSKVMCIGYMYSFTKNSVYDISPDGILIDDDGDPWPSLSEEYSYFFAHFKYVDEADLAKAKLIAAAPDLLEALQRLREHLKTITARDAAGENELAWLRGIADTAINKALD